MHKPLTGNIYKYLEIFDTVCELTELLPKYRVYVIGDFNLFDQKAKETSVFEDYFIKKYGLYRTTSISTHFKPGCGSTCRENILTNEI